MSRRSHDPDETVAANQLGRAVGEHSQAQGCELLERVVHPPGLLSPLDQFSSKESHCDSYERSQNDLHRSKPDPESGTLCAMGGTGKGDHQKKNRERQNIIEPTLHVDRLPNANPYSATAQDGLSLGHSPFSVLP